MRNNTIQYLFLSMLVILAGCTSPTSTPTDTFELLVFVTPVEAGTMNPVAGIYDENTPVQLQATPSEGWRFVEWDGDVTGTQNPMMIRMTRDFTVVAKFEKRDYELTITTEGEGSVLEEVITGRGYPFQTMVRLTAQAASGWQFDSWEGALTGTENPQHITITTAVTVKALFSQLSASFTLNAPVYLDEQQAHVTGSVTLPNGLVGASVGLCYGTTEVPSETDRCIGNVNPASAFSYYLTRLNDHTRYFLRGYTEINGTRTYSETQIEFTTPQATYQKGNGVTDIEGNSYRTVIIGQQEWMAENLRTTQFSGGTAIRLLTTYNEVLANRGPAYTWPDLDVDKFNIYGPLYHASVAVGPSIICPAGWSIPSSDDVHALASYLGKTEHRKSFTRDNDNLIGGMLKSTSELWNSPNVHATDRFGFSAEPAGWISPFTQGNSGAWSPFWIRVSETGAAGYFGVSANNGGFQVSTIGDYSTGIAASIRCIRE
jgi:uncharacterized protein (TIGR02145 family)